MRISKKKLSSKPDAEYTSLLKGQRIIVRVYHEPETCVQIETQRDCHTYPVTYEQYQNYMDDAERILHPSKAVYKRLLENAQQNSNRFKNDPDLYRFWTHVTEHYKLVVDSLNNGGIYGNK